MDQDVQEFGRPATHQIRPGGRRGRAVQTLPQPIHEAELKSGRLQIALPRGSRPQPGEKHEPTEQDRQRQLDAQPVGARSNGVADAARLSVRRAFDAGGVQERNQQRDAEDLGDGRDEEQHGGQRRTTRSMAQQGAGEPASAVERARPGVRPAFRQPVRPRRAGHRPGRGR